VDLGLTGRRALVFGSTSGLGLAVAESLAAEGARVAIAGRRADVASEVAGRLPGAIAVPGDITEDGTPERLVAEAAAGAGVVVDFDSAGLDSAGLLSLDFPLDEDEEEEVDEPVELARLSVR